MHWNGNKCHTHAGKGKGKIIKYYLAIFLIFALFKEFLYFPGISEFHICSAPRTRRRIFICKNIIIITHDVAMIDQYLKSEIKSLTQQAGQSISLLKYKQIHQSAVESECTAAHFCFQSRSYSRVSIVC